MKQSSTSSHSPYQSSRSSTPSKTSFGSGVWPCPSHLTEGLDLMTTMLFTKGGATSYWTARPYDSTFRTCSMRNTFGSSFSIPDCLPEVWVQRQPEAPAKYPRPVPKSERHLQKLPNKRHHDQGDDPLRRRSPEGQSSSNNDSLSYISQWVSLFLKRKLVYHVVPA